MDGIEQARWSRFCGGLLEYIDSYYSRLIKTDYEIELNMSGGDILAELQMSSSIDDLSPQLRAVAEQYKRSLESS